MTDRPDPHDYLTVKELAKLLRVSERKVYDLVEKNSVPCTRATGKLLFPRQAVQSWLDAASGGGGRLQSGGGRAPNVFLGSHDPLLERALRDSQCGLATLFDSSLDGLTRFAAGEGIATGLHLYDSGQDAWNVPFVESACRNCNAVLMGWAERRRGLVVRREDAAAIQAPADLPGRRVMRRQAEAGTEALFRFVLAEDEIDEAALTVAGVARSEQDAVLAVAEGRADVCFGLESVARPFGLAFVPVKVEHFDMLIDRRAWFEDPIQAFIQHCGTEAFKAQAAAVAGYDMEPLGLVRWNA